MSVVVTSARVLTAPGAAPLHGGNRSNLGHDGGMLKGFADHASHIQHKRLTTAGTLSGARRPYFFIKPMADDDKPSVRPNRKGSITRLRKLEKRTLWMTSLVASVAAAFHAVKRFSLFKSYDDQIRCSTRQAISKKQSIAQRQAFVRKQTSLQNADSAKKRRTAA